MREGSEKNLSADTREAINELEKCGGQLALNGCGPISEPGSQRTWD